MSQILQDRDESELKLMIDRFIQTMRLHHQVSLPYADLVPVAAQCMQHKVGELMADWMGGFSVPELMKIINILNSNSYENRSPKKDTKNKASKPSLQ